MICQETREMEQTVCTNDVIPAYKSYYKRILGWAFT
jgi:hypothetical protein